MRPDLKKLAVNSTVVYVIAFLLTTLSHELAHALMGVALGGKPVLHNNYVASTEGHLPLASVVAVKLAGPLWSLVQGIAFTLPALRRRRRDVLQLLVLWLAVLGYNNFLGYLFTGPFSTVGDIGSVERMLGLPTAAVIAISLAGIGAQLAVVWRMRGPFLSFAFSDEQLATAPARKRVLLAALIAPWFLGSVAFTLLSLPSPALISLVYPLSSGMPFIMPWQAAGNPRARDGILPGDGSAAARISLVAIGILIAMALVNQFVLKPGIALY